MEQRLSVVTLGVGSLERSRHFYEQGLGWSVGRALEQVVFFQLNGLVFALYPREALGEDAGISLESTGPPGIALAYNARSTEEVDAVLGQASEAGGRIMKPAQTVFWGGYSGYFADLDDYLWEVAYNPYWTVDIRGNVSLGST